MNSSSEKYERVVAQFGVHISHNGDFDTLSAYSHVAVMIMIYFYTFNCKHDHRVAQVNEDVGHWLERVLHVPNDLRGDSPKIAGCFDLMRVQGRWAAAARLGRRLPAVSLTHIYIVSLSNLFHTNPISYSLRALCEHLAGRRVWGRSAQEERAQQISERRLLEAMGAFLRASLDATYQ